MKALRIVVVGLAMSMLWACSQTVSGSDKDSRGDDGLSDVPGYHPVDGKDSANGSSANGNTGSSSSRGGGLSSSSEIYPDDDGGDSNSSGLDITRYIPNGKMDCKFTVDDDVWEMGYEGADTTMHAVIEYKPDGYVWVDCSGEEKTGSVDECEETAGVFQFLKMFAEASPEVDMQMDAKCDGDRLTFSFKGRTDEKYTPESKQEDYNERCL